MGTQSKRSAKRLQKERLRLTQAREELKLQQAAGAHRSAEQSRLELSYHEFEQRSSGPLPPPQQLLEYNTVLPDAAERIFRQFEENSAHVRNRDIEILVIQAADRRSQHGHIRWGQVLGFVAVLTIATFGFICVLYDHDEAGKVIVGSAAGLAVLASAFTSLAKRSEKAASQTPNEPAESPLAKKS